MQNDPWQVIHPPRGVDKKEDEKGMNPWYIVVAKQTMKGNIPMDMITQAFKLFLESACNILTSGSLIDFGSKMAGIQTAANTMVTNILPHLISEVDDVISQDPERKKDWKTVRMDQRTLITAIGELHFPRRYYQHKQTGDRAYLLDEALGIQANAKVNGDVRQKTVELASQQSYSKSAQAATTSSLSRMSACNYVGDLKTFPALEAQGERRVVKQLYVEADEDHVSLQNGKTTIVKLVYIHEGVRQEGKRRILVNPVYLTSPLEESPDKLWEKVSDYIGEQYDADALERIFLSGDGAPWIRTGEDWLYPCIPILDSFHVMKALRQLCGGSQERINTFLSYVRKNEFNSAKALFEEILKETPELKRDRKLKQINYLQNNWIRIRNQNHPGAQGCSAEGHISHILSERLSSRPMGWSKKNMMNITQLRIMSANGQAIQYEDLRKTKEDKIAFKSEKELSLLNTLHSNKTIKRKIQSSLQTLCRKLPVLENAATSPLYHALHGLSYGSLVC